MLFKFTISIRVIQICLFISDISVDTEKELQRRTIIITVKYRGEEMYFFFKIEVQIRYKMQKIQIFLK